MKRKKFTLERHRELGAQLLQIRDVFVFLRVELDQTVGRRESNRASVIARKIDELRNELDEVFCRDYPVEFNTATYYPHAVQKLHPRMYQR
jgi:hypothetical protein